MAHSNQMREFLLDRPRRGVADVYIGRVGRTGSARLARRRRNGRRKRSAQEFQRQQAHNGGRRKALEAQIAALRARLTVAEQERKLGVAQEEMRRGDGRPPKPRWPRAGTPMHCQATPDYHNSCQGETG